MGLFLLVFITAMTAIFCVRDTLIQYTLGAGGVEALLLAGLHLRNFDSRQQQRLHPARPQGVLNVYTI